MSSYEFYCLRLSLLVPTRNENLRQTYPSNYYLRVGLYVRPGKEHAIILSFLRFIHFLEHEITMTACLLNDHTISLKRIRG